MSYNNSTVKVKKDDDDHERSEEAYISHFSPYKSRHFIRLHHGYGGNFHLGRAVSWRRPHEGGNVVIQRIETCWVEEFGMGRYIYALRAHIPEDIKGMTVMILASK